MSDKRVEPVALLPCKRQRTCDTNWDKCLICQDTSGVLSVGTAHGIVKFKEALAKRKEYNDTFHAELFERLDCESADLEANTPKWHSKSCYASFCSQTNIDRLRSKAIAKENDIERICITEP